MENRDIVIVGLQPWDIEIGSNCKNIALELSKKNRVLYVNRALDRITKIRRGSDSKVKERLRSIKGEVADLTEVEPNLWVLNPRIILESVNSLPGFLFNTLNKINNARIAKAIKNAACRLGFGKDLILFIDNDFFRAYHLPEMLQVQCSIYYIRDFLTEQPYFKKHGARMEQGIMRKVDFVTANSAYLADYARNYNKEAVDIGQGCDFSLFNKERYELPETLFNIPTPRIGYVGALIGSRLDINLLIALAVAKSDWNLVLVGPEDGAFESSQLHSMPNVHFLGKKSQDALPAYIAHFDVCLNPQLVNKLTIGNYPRKIDEYLALGKPVVATYTEFMKSFQEYVYLCKDKAEYIAAIEKALSEDTTAHTQERIDFALSHSWENSVKKLNQAYHNFANKVNQINN